MKSSPDRAAVTDVRLSRTEGFFARLDPSPMVVRDLDDAVEEFLVDCALDRPGRRRSPSGSICPPPTRRRGPKRSPPPVEIFPYDWRPMRRKQQVYGRLAEARVEVCIDNAG